MGTFLTNVHVHSRSGHERETHDAVLAAVRELVTAAGLVPCEEAESATRTVIVGPPERWIAVYDQRTEHQYVEHLAELAMHLSRRTSEPVLAALVHDSDHLLFRLYRGGTLLDAIDTYRHLEGDVQHWAPLAADPGRLAGLRAAFEARPLLLEEKLVAIGVELGIAPASLGRGYDTRKHEPLPAGAVALRFRRAPSPRASCEPPRFASGGGCMHVELSVGETFQVSGGVYNRGGPSTGFGLVVTGAAVSDGLLVPERAAIVRMRGNEHETIELDLQRREPGIYIARHPDVTLVGYPPLGPEELATLSPLELFAIDWATRIDVNVYGRVEKPGPSQVELGFVPLANREGAVGYAITVDVRPPSRVPLHGAARSAGSYRDLEIPEVLVLLAVSTLPPEEATSLALDLVERWSDFWKRPGKLRGFVEDGAAEPVQRTPRNVTLNLDGMPKGARWKKLRRRLADASTARFLGPFDTGEPTEEGRFPRRDDGLELASRPLPTRHPEDPELPAVVLTVSLRGRPAEEIQAMVEAARRWLDEHAVRARCTQAFLARWRSSSSLDGTAYETACAIDGPCTRRRSWATRYLRGVSSDGLWLGPELVAHVDRAALETVAHVEPLADIVRVLPRAGVSLDALEAALAPLLPTKAQAEEANVALLPRHLPGGSSCLRGR